LTALPRYIPSSTFGNGKPIGFQRCVNDENKSGSNSKIKCFENILIRKYAPWLMEVT
jgi:hypothetical protein